MYDMGAEMYVVLEGEVELTIGERVVETLGPGEPFGEPQFALQIMKVMADRLRKMNARL